MAVEVKLPAEAFQKGLHDTECKHGIPAIKKQQQKFVFAQPIDAGLIRRGGQSSRDLLQKLVANRMAKRVVNVLESVEVKRRNSDGKRGIACAFPQDRVEVLVQADAVGKPGELIKMGEAPELLFGRLPFSHVAAEEEVLLLGLGPHAGPSQGNNSPVFVNVSSFKIAHVVLPCARQL